jgi:hypothetical protein
MVTTSDCFTPLPVYSVERPVTLSLTQNGPLEESEIPQGFHQVGVDVFRHSGLVGDEIDLSVLRQGLLRDEDQGKGKPS